MRKILRPSLCLLMAVLLFPALSFGGKVAPSLGDGPILPPPTTCRGVSPGDVNSDGQIDIGDLVFLVNLLCHDGPSPFPLANGDVNADCMIDMGDINYLVAYMFEGGPAPMDCVCGDPIIGSCVATCDGVVPGDANSDGQLDIGDVVFLVNLLCHDGPPPNPLGNGDVNADCEIDLDDVYYLVDYMFKGGPAPMDCACGAPTIGECESSCDYVVSGDANSDGQIDISDVVFLINLLCHDGPPPSPLGNGDVNADCVIDLDDVYYLVNYMFKGGPAPLDCACGTPTIGECESSCDYVVSGDANSDGQIDISDVVFMVNLLCHDGPPPSPLGNGDVNADCIIDMDDIDYLVAYMFQNGPAPLDCACGTPTIGDCIIDCDGVVPGDVDSSGQIDISDVVFLVDFLCNDGSAPSPLGNADVNADCIIDMDDIDYLVAYMFESGPAPMDCMCGVPVVGECDPAKANDLDLDQLKTEKDMPTRFGMDQNYPNPFNPMTAISFSLPAGSNVRLEIYNVAGEKVRTLVDRAYGPGDHTVSWDGTDARGTAASAGVYFYTITADGFAETRKMMLIK